ncbi:7946_t:CDS:2 [Acaulospora morrowiae]|uniref:7946_t:CDS:1 n=1 Tax=Acaulospora morrowiae TaxID=94023 RepID=A0A9N9B648_9GLOM|nr:7946_t:CDS:2 [Acaulospora morrowiae]
MKRCTNEVQYEINIADARLIKKAAYYIAPTTKDFMKQELN